MKKYLLVLALAVGITCVVLPSTTSAAYRVRGYYRSSGTYVMPHYKTAPNHTRLDNYSTKYNYNPYTGSRGYKSLYPTYR